MITPAKSHPEVIVAAIAARDIKRAHAYAQKYNIPIVHSSYQGKPLSILLIGFLIANLPSQALLDDPSIDVVYIALPNSHHFEWSLRSLQAGKHVLLEKPCCSNATEARRLFNHPLLTSPNSPVLLEAFHYQFHPAWQIFLTQVHQYPGSIQSASSQFYLPWLVLGKDDIRFKYSLGGGCLMDIATYCVSSVRQIVGRQTKLSPTEVNYRPDSSFLGQSDTEPQIDKAMSAKFLTPSSQSIQIQGDSAFTGWPSFLPYSWRNILPTFPWPKSEAVFEPVLVDTMVQEDGVPLQHFSRRTITIWNHIFPFIYHRIDISDLHTLRRGEDIVKSWNDIRYEKAYNWPKDDKRAVVYRDWWSTYRCQLEEFVNRIKDREGSGVWIDREESILQMETIDETYESAGLKPRATREFEI